MTDIIKKIRKKLPWFWIIVEFINGKCIKILYNNIVNNVKKNIDGKKPDKNDFNIVFRSCNTNNAAVISTFLNRLTSDETQWFKPFPFDEHSVCRILQNPGFLFFVATSGSSIVGVFFLRLFFTRKAFLGFVVDKSMRGKGLGTEMIRIQIECCKSLGFSLMSTVSESNISSYKAHLKAGNFQVVERMDNNYMVLKLMDKNE
jgi:RimJ/RimL family protein N-acetyltransferase